jgi:hypothetical protein
MQRRDPFLQRQHSVHDGPFTGSVHGAHGERDHVLDRLLHGHHVQERHRRPRQLLTAAPAARF